MAEVKGGRWGGAITPPQFKIILEILVLEVESGIQLENFDTCDLTNFFEKAELISLTLDSLKSISQYQV